MRRLSTVWELPRNSLKSAGSLDIFFGFFGRDFDAVRGECSVSMIRVEVVGCGEQVVVGIWLSAGSIFFTTNCGSVLCVYFRGVLIPQLMEEFMIIGRPTWTVLGASLCNLRLGFGD